MAVDGVLQRELGDQLRPPGHIIELKDPIVAIGFACPTAGARPNGIEKRIEVSPEVDIGDGTAHGPPVVGAIVVIGVYFIGVQLAGVAQGATLGEGIVPLLVFMDIRGLGGEDVLFADELILGVKADVRKAVDGSAGID